MRTHNSRKVLGTTLTVASLTLSSLIGTAALAAENVATSDVPTKSAVEDQALPDIRVRYEAQNIDLSSADLTRAE